jgi:hypothetical protein
MPHRISFTLSEEDLVLIDAWLRCKRSFGHGPGARANLARKAVWEYMRRNGLTRGQKALAVKDSANGPGYLPRYCVRP